MSQATWDPAQYERFRAERAQPFDDLLALVRPKPGMRVLDLGCGTGELTRELHLKLAASRTLGIDSSAEMLARSGEHAAPGLEFRQADIAEFAAQGEYDLIFSNAALQWLPDHPGLLARLAGALAPGGQLAVQVPANFDQPAHVVADAVAGSEPFHSAMGDYRRGTPVAEPEVYATLLHRQGYQAQHVRLQIYGHLLPGPEDVVEWVKGTLLTEFQRRLSPELFALFLERYRERLLPVLPETRPFFFPFKRLLFWGQRAA